MPVLSNKQMIEIDPTVVVEKHPSIEWHKCISVSNTVCPKYCASSMYTRCLQSSGWAGVDQAVTKTSK